LNFKIQVKMGKTFELAKKLGVVKTRYFNGILRDKDEAQWKKQKFTHFMVIDFEATCWDQKPGPPSEIIEFPAVILDASSSEIWLTTFHNYVQPIEEPILSEFCTNLTGITQEQVEIAAPLGATLMRFNTWLKEHCSDIIFNAAGTGPNIKNCAVVTWTNWDLQICLDNECKRKNLSMPSCFKSWIDLKHVYKKFYQRQPQGLNGALQEMGLKFDGREHSGLADAKNTAKLLAKMIKDGCVLGLTKGLKDTKIDSKLAFDDNQLNLVNLQLQTSPATTSKSPASTSKSPGANTSKSPGSNIFKTPGNTSKSPGANTFKTPGNTSKSPGADTFKTPGNTSKSPGSNTSKSPGNTSNPRKENNNSWTGIKKTPPLCGCGRRSKFLVVSKPGPNCGRRFYSCPKTSGCQFFKWDSPENNLGQSPAFKPPRQVIMK